jgi:hypothetical protein
MLQARFAPWSGIAGFAELMRKPGTIDWELGCWIADRFASAESSAWAVRSPKRLLGAHSFRLSGAVGR